MEKVWCHYIPHEKGEQQLTGFLHKEVYGFRHIIYMRRLFPDVSTDKEENGHIGYAYQLVVHKVIGITVRQMLDDH